MYIGESQPALEDLPLMAEKRYLERTSQQPNGNSRIARSHSLNLYEQSSANDLVEKMKRTFEFKLNAYKGFKSYKGNIRPEYIQSSFVTLEDLLKKLPEDVRFDVEISEHNPNPKYYTNQFTYNFDLTEYPMLFEAHDWGMDTYAVELNYLTDTILEKIYRLAGNRTLFFSSFSPEICILLSRKQQVYPVYFLTEAGHIPSADARADSLREAIHFAKAWRLPGVITRSQPLVISPGLTRKVKEAGLTCISWGELNDEPEHAKV